MPAPQPGLTRGEDSAPGAPIELACPQILLNLPLCLCAAAFEGGVESPAEKVLLLGHGRQLPPGTWTPGPEPAMNPSGQCPRGLASARVAARNGANLPESRCSKVPPRPP